AIGPDARDAIPALMEATNDNRYQVRQAAADALEAIALTVVVDGKTLPREEIELDEEEQAIAVRVAATRLESKDWMTRRDAANRLAEMGDTAAPAVPALILALSDDSDWYDHYNEVRRAAATALGNIGFEARAANPALIEALDNRDYAVRLAVVKALGKIGPKSASNVIEALTTAVADPDFDVRREAAVSLGSFEECAIPALPVLVTATMTDMDQDVRREAVESICRIEPGTENSLCALGVALKDEDPDLRNEALIALRRAKNPAARKAMLPEVLKRLDDVDENVRMNAVKTLSEFDIGTGQVCNALERLANEDKSLEVKKKAAETLLELKQQQVEELKTGSDSAQ
ncbi:MAG: sister chromatid cohesion protein PDS5, partial [Desulfosudaceae bacterium]